MSSNFRPGPAFRQAVDRRTRQMRRNRRLAAGASVIAAGLAIALPLALTSGRTPSTVHVVAPASTLPPTTAPRPLDTVPQTTAPTPTTTPPTTVPTPRTVASTPSPTGCNLTLTVSNDGTVAPLFCPDGYPNLAALSYYRSNHGGMRPSVLRLPASATRTQVLSAMCADIGPAETMGLQTEQQAYDLAARLNGWTYGINTVTDLQSCPSPG